MNKEYTDYLQSKEWAEIRNDLYEVRGRKCERCESKNDLTVHHKNYQRLFYEEPEDLEILCASCHRKEHGLTKKGLPVRVTPPHLTVVRGAKPELKKQAKFWQKKKKKKNANSVKAARNYFSSIERKRKKYPNKRLH